MREREDRVGGECFGAKWKVASLRKNSKERQGRVGCEQNGRLPLPYIEREGKRVLDRGKEE